MDESVKDDLDARIREAKLDVSAKARAWEKAYDSLWYAWYLRQPRKGPVDGNPNDPRPWQYAPELRKVIASYPEPERAIAQAYLDARDHLWRLVRERYLK